MNDIHHLTGAYAVDALDEEERGRFEAHLAGCPDCRAEVDSLREAAGLLSSTTELTPPPGLRDSVLAGISQVRPLPPPGSSQPDAELDVRRDARRDARPARRRWLPLLAAAVVLGVIGVGVAVTEPFSGVDPCLAPPPPPERGVGPHAPESVEVPAGAGGRATVIRSASVGKAVIRTEDMAPAPEGKVYELWLQSPEGEMLPAGLMPDEADAEVLLDGDAATATAAGITVEPDGGSPAPTSEPIALFDFSQAT